MKSFKNERIQRGFFLFDTCFDTFKKTKQIYFFTYHTTRTHAMPKKLSAFLQTSVDCRGKMDQDATKTSKSLASHTDGVVRPTEW